MNVFFFFFLIALFYLIAARNDRKSITCKSITIKAFRRFLISIADFYNIISWYVLINTSFVYNNICSREKRGREEENVEFIWLVQWCERLKFSRRFTKRDALIVGSTQGLDKSFVEHFLPFPKISLIYLRELIFNLFSSIGESFVFWEFRIKQ